jgi:hypothetical protein
VHAVNVVHHRRVASASIRLRIVLLNLLRHFTGFGPARFRHKSGTVSMTCTAAYSDVAPVGLGMLESAHEPICVTVLLQHVDNALVHCATCSTGRG